MRNHWLADVVVARSVSVATAGDINLRGRLRRINGVGNPRESVLWVANDGSLLLQTSFLEWMAYQPENAACAIVISILC